MKIAVLLTCYNRKNKTLTCLKSLYLQEGIDKHTITVFLVDDNSPDQTGEAVKNAYPEVHIIHGSGSLFWAGGMRKAWQEAKKQNIFDAYLLLNDDVTLYPNVITNLIETHQYAIAKFNKAGIYTGTTINPETKIVSYGGRNITSYFSGKSVLVEPDNKFVKSCDFANANILFVTKEVVAKIDILSDRFTQNLADYDYTLRAKKKHFPILIIPGFSGFCEDDHGKNWLPSNSTLKQRIDYLKNPKYLAYSQYMYYMKTHFPMAVPLAFIKLWLKTFFPGIWTRFK